MWRTSNYFLPACTNAAASRERRGERMDRQQDSDQPHGELRLLITHPLVHASQTTATTTRPRKREEKDPAVAVFSPGQQRVRSSMGSKDSRPQGLTRARLRRLGPLFQSPWRPGFNVELIQTKLTCAAPQRVGVKHTFRVLLL